MPRLSKAHCLLLALLVPLCAVAQEAALGRLFLTQQERDVLNEVRKLNGRGEVQGKPASSITLDGYILRKNGKNTTWVNQQVHSAHQRPPGVAVMEKNTVPGMISLLLPSGKTIMLRPGQSYDVGDERTREVYELKASKPEAAPDSKAKP